MTRRSGPQFATQQTRPGVTTSRADGMHNKTARYAKKMHKGNGITWMKKSWSTKRLELCCYCLEISLQAWNQHVGSAIRTCICRGRAQQGPYLHLKPLPTRVGGRLLLVWQHGRLEDTAETKSNFLLGTWYSYPVWCYAAFITIRACVDWPTYLSISYFLSLRCSSGLSFPFLGACLHL